MNVVVTGAAGFVGSRVADALLNEGSTIAVAQLLLVDSAQPPARADPRVSSVALDLTSPGAAALVISSDTHLVFHLAAVVSGHAEADFDCGLRVNFDATRALLEEIRRTAPTARFVFSSTVGVFGGNLPALIDGLTAVTPQTSYGAQKAMCELLINDYSRKGYVDGRILRLPTVSVRAGAPNRAVTSFASGIIREPLAGIECVCPVDPSQKLWLASPRSIVANILYAGTLTRAALGDWRVVNLPGMTVAVRDMLEALERVCGQKVAALVRFERDDLIARMVASFPVNFDNTRATQLGFIADKEFDEVIKGYIADYLR